MESTVCLNRTSYSIPSYFTLTLQVLHVKTLYIPSTFLDMKHGCASLGQKPLIAFDLKNVLPIVESSQEVVRHRHSWTSL